MNEAKTKCECGRILLLGSGVKITAINKVVIDLSQANGNMVILCKCGRKTSISLDLIGEMV